jgi:hypothetical protein
MVKLGTVVYVEGGGTKVFEQKTYRIGFKKMINQRANIISCGGNGRTHEKSVEHSGEQRALLLVDSELPVVEGDSALDHLKRTMAWRWPNTVTEEHVHLMATTVETWISCDPEALGTYFGSKFVAAKLVATTPIESARKEDVLRKLEDATKGGKNGGYTKSPKHAAELLRSSTGGRSQPSRKSSASASSKPLDWPSMDFDGWAFCKPRPRIRSSLRNCVFVCT